jgi:hypothetical protein
VRILKYSALCLFLLCPALAPSQEKAKPDPVKPTERLTGMWRGTYHYPQGGGQQSVNFDLVLIQDGKDVVAVLKEPNTFGNRKEPFLAAVCKGSFDAQAGKLTFTKTYDGTAGPNHPVEYAGDLSKDGAKMEGKWDLGGFSGTFTLERVKDTRAGPFAGVWSGFRHYPKAKGLAPVKFQMVLVHKGDEVTGFIKEPNATAANKEEPYLHSAFTGKYDARTGRLTFTKTYDGTAGEKHSVNCGGKVSFDRLMVEGLWTIPNAAAGRLTLLRQSLDRKTVAELK